jgi:hypothetical protein
VAIACLICVPLSYINNGNVFSLASDLAVMLLLGWAGACLVWRKDREKLRVTLLIGLELCSIVALFVGWTLLARVLR